MRVIALGNLSGAIGEKAKGEDFTIEAKIGAELISRGLVRAADEPQLPVKKADQVKE